jgi:hypothetical protein
MYDLSVNRFGQPLAFRFVYAPQQTPLPKITGGRFDNRAGGTAEGPPTRVKNGWPSMTRARQLIRILHV